MAAAARVQFLMRYRKLSAGRWNLLLTPVCGRVQGTVVPSIA